MTGQYFSVKKTEKYYYYIIIGEKTNLSLTKKFIY